MDIFELIQAYFDCNRICCKCKMCDLCLFM